MHPRLQHSFRLGNAEVNGSTIWGCEGAAIECHQRLGGLLRYYRPERLKWQGRAGAVDSVSAVLARGLRAEIPRVFLRSRDRGSEDAVVFPGIGCDGFFD